jgi:phosphoglycolate phosphatase
MRFRHILFDLDGTLTDPAVGICSSIMFALQKGGYAVGKISDYYKFIGPPLLLSLQQHCGVTTEEAKRLLAYYRERFSAVGMFENSVYPGIPQLLCELRAAGTKLILATSKPEVFAVRILEHFGLASYFDCIAGSDLEGARSQKSQVIAYALRKSGITESRDCVMVGDRLYDIEGAGENGLQSIGVLYGYGDEEELRGAGADTIVRTVDELRDFLLEG